MTSLNSDEHAESSKVPWQKPSDVRSFAAQVNDVATKLLNGEIDIGTARVYSNLARAVVQSASIVTTRARFLKLEPDLSLEQGEADDDASN